MRKMTIPDTELKLSPIGLGCVNAGLKWDGKEADYLFDAFLDMGGNLYDTARVYSDWIPPEIGRSERVLGDWLTRSKKRNQIVIITKGGHPDMTGDNPDTHKSRVYRAEMRTDIELSLKALRTDYIDIYFYHRDDESIPVEELIETMEAFVKSGKIRYYGCSNWTTQRMEKAAKYCKEKGYRGFVANQALYNVGYAHMNPLDDDTMLAIDGPMQKFHKENPGNLAMPYMGVCSGFFNKILSKGEEAVKDSPYYTEGNIRIAQKLKQIMEKYGATATQAVLGFFTCQDFACLPLYGPRGAESLEEACGTFEIPFTKEDYELV
ncbi:aldo/keto reductase [Mediterraneibacter sp. NSJ-55]|uniref:Aldo/keto reductase n=1 Tax=Mediterraneibacter hominis TaxID=2763054 RepID=A0A923LM84_9FIRM|nr:aldo/keto reductase [Mediterraneibacter hominis]MBC5690501.1 aldo/keto reductase [Mediterraneibacter hominis]